MLWTRSGPPCPWPVGRAVAWCLERHPLLMVGTDPVEVDGVLAAGRLRCPGCTGRLGPWGRARPRSVREEHGQVRHRPRRSGHWSWLCGAERLGAAGPPLQDQCPEAA